MRLATHRLLPGSDGTGTDTGGPGGGKAREASEGRIPEDRRRGLLRIPTRPSICECARGRKLLPRVSRSEAAGLGASARLGFSRRAGLAHLPAVPADRPDPSLAQPARTSTSRAHLVTLRTGSSPAASRSHPRATDLAAWPVSWQLRRTHRGQAPPGYDAWGNFRLQSSEYPADHGHARRGVYEGIASASALSPDSAAPAGPLNTVVVSGEGHSPPNRPNNHLPKNGSSVPRSIGRWNQVAFSQRAQARWRETRRTPGTEVPWLAAGGILSPCHGRKRAAGSDVHQPGPPGSAGRSVASCAAPTKRRRGSPRSRP
jgi:hypothetical protein